MRLLLDSNVLIRLADERLDTLAAPLRTALTAPDSEIHASVASLWEIAIKHRLGKLALKVALPKLPELIANAGTPCLRSRRHMRLLRSIRNRRRAIRSTGCYWLSARLKDSCC
ncbi:MAG TPA: hypothetical protein VG274_08385 [Rhizomicrobium sp.]|jgi:PIN domain nuclease of toxin-antitoxin system|nr:hypothetical protein [Rhizomicrobium sp.]